MDNHINFKEAWDEGYQEYRDYARQELHNGYQRNPAISATAEVLGAVASPIKPFSGMTGAVTNGVIGGVGMTDINNPTEYAVNIGLNTLGSVAGEKFGGILDDKIKNVFGNNYRNITFGATNLSKASRLFTKAGVNGFTNQINNRRKDDK